MSFSPKFLPLISGYLLWICSTDKRGVVNESEEVFLHTVQHYGQQKLAIITGIFTELLIISFSFLDLQQQITKLFNGLTLHQIIIFQSGSKKSKYKVSCALKDLGKSLSLPLLVIPRTGSGILTSIHTSDFISASFLCLGVTVLLIRMVGIQFGTHC